MRAETERFWEKVDKTETCWNWTAYLDKDGYGTYTISPGRTVRPHRYAYEMLVGPIPPGMVVDHLCHNRRCCNPDHLSVTTNEANVRRALGRQYSLYCLRGHELFGVNIRVRNGERTCKVCERERGARRRGTLVGST